MDVAQLDKITNIIKKGAPPNETNMAESLGVLLYPDCGCLLVLDALNECKADSIKKFLRLLAPFSKNARVMISSRELGEIQSNLYNYYPLGHLLHIQINENDNESDIRNFLVDRVSLLELEDDEMENEIVSELLGGAKGMFL